MRRVFPLRPAEKSMLVTYRASQDQVQDEEESQNTAPPPSAAQKNPNAVSRMRHLSETEIPMLWSTDEASSSTITRPKLSSHLPQKSASAYPVFTGGASLNYSSPRSPLSFDSSLEEDWKNSSEDRQACASSSCTSSSASSSSSLTFGGFVRDVPYQSANINPGTENHLSSDVAAVIPGNLRVKIGRDPDRTSAPCSEGAAAVQPRHSRRHSSATPTGSCCRSFEYTSSCFNRTTGSVSTGSDSSSTQKSTASSKPLASDSKKSAASSKPCSNKSPFKCLSARIVAQKLVKTLRKDKLDAHDSRTSSKLNVADDRVSFSVSCEPCEEAKKHDRTPLGQAPAVSRSSEASCTSTSGMDSEELWFFSGRSATRSTASDRWGSHLVVSQKSDAGYLKNLEAKALAKEELAAKSDTDKIAWDKMFGSTGMRSVAFPSEEFSFLNVDVLLQEISTLCRQKRYLALEVASEIRTRITVLQNAADTLRCMQTEVEGRVIAAEKDKANAHVEFEGELERREEGWLSKFDKIKLEEKRLKERVIDMAEERVGFQKVIASHKLQEDSWKSQMKDSELLLNSLRQRSWQAEKDLVELKKAFSEMCNRLKIEECELDAMTQRNRFLELENTMLQKDATRLRRTFEEQERTIKGFWLELSEMVFESSDDKNQTRKKLQKELLRLAGVEMRLRSEIDALHDELWVLKQEKGMMQEVSPADPLKVNCYLRGRTGATYQKLPSQRKVTEDASEGHMLVPPGAQYQSKEDLEYTWKVLNCKLHKQEAGLLEEDIDARDSVVNELLVKLYVANQRVHNLELQLGKREEEIELLRAELQDQASELNELRNELPCLRRQRDEFCKEADYMSKEALRLSTELAELRKVAEKLDEELMVKEGQLSILQQFCNEVDS